MLVILNCGSVFRFELNVCYYFTHIHIHRCLFSIFRC
nr:MAG TPA: hypothetical protein [Bacteriophage sp.]